MSEVSTDSTNLPRVTVVGAGIMGSGIAQVAATAAHDTVLHDVTDEALASGLDAVDRSLARFVMSGRLTDEQARAARARIRATTDLEDALAEADSVIEAVPEILALKHEVLGEVVNLAPPDALLATNTSQLSITTVATVLDDNARRFVGMHFFNPPVMMRLVELVRGLQTEDATLERARALAEGFGKTVVVCSRDSPGFITSRAYAALRLECLRMLEEGVASAEDIDTAMKLGFNFPMGPLELGDFNGIDTFLHVTTALWEAHGERFRPTVGLRNLVAAGRLGRKTGAGFYDYDDDGNKLPPR